MAKSRHIGRPPLDSRFILTHSSAQARIFSRDARGSEGGGCDVSTGEDACGGTGATAAGGGAAGARAGAPAGCWGDAGRRGGVGFSCSSVGAGCLCFGCAGAARFGGNGVVAAGWPCASEARETSMAQIVVAAPLRRRVKDELRAPVCNVYPRASAIAVAHL